MNILRLLASILFATLFTSCIINIDKSIINNKILFHYKKDDILSSLIFNTNNIRLKGHTIQPTNDIIHFVFKEKKNDYSITINKNTLLNFNVNVGVNQSKLNKDVVKLNLDSFNIEFSSPLIIRQSSHVLTEINSLSSFDSLNLGINYNLFKTRIFRVLSLVMFQKSFKLDSSENPKIFGAIPDLFIENVEMNTINRRPINFMDNEIVFGDGVIKFGNFTLHNNIHSLNDITGLIELSNCKLYGKNISLALDSAKLFLNDINFSSTEFNNSIYADSNGLALFVEKGEIVYNNPNTESQLYKSTLRKSYFYINEFKYNKYLKLTPNIKIRSTFSSTIENFAISATKYEFSSKLIEIPEIKCNYENNNKLINSNITLNGNLIFNECDLIYKDSTESIILNKFVLSTQFKTETNIDTLNFKLDNLSINPKYTQLVFNQGDSITFNDGIACSIKSDINIVIFENKILDTFGISELSIKSNNINYSSYSGKFKFTNVNLNLLYEKSRIDDIVSGSIGFNSEISTINDDKLNTLFRNSTININSASFKYNIDSRQFNIDIPKLEFVLAESQINNAIKDLIKTPKYLGRVGEIPIKIKVKTSWFRFSWGIGHIGLYLTINDFWLHKFSFDQTNKLFVNLGGKIKIDTDNGSVSLTLKEFMFSLAFNIETPNFASKCMANFVLECDPRSVDIGSVPPFVESGTGFVRKAISKQFDTNGKVELGKLIHGISKGGEELFDKLYIRSFDVVSQDKKMHFTLSCKIEY